MARYRRNYSLNVSMPSDGRAEASQRLANSFANFSNTVNQVRRPIDIADAERAAGQVIPSAQAPEMKSPLTLFGRRYNEVVLKGHMAATQNAMNRHISELATRYQDNPNAFAASANEIRGAYLNEVAPEIKGATAVSFDAVAGGYLDKIKTQHAQEMLDAAIAEQGEALANTKSTALEALTRGNDEVFTTMTGIYQEALAGSDLKPAEKVKAFIKYKRDANMAVSMGEIRGHLEGGDYKAAIEHINGVRKGDIPMVFPDAGMTPEDAADYLNEQFKKFVGDYEAELKAVNTQQGLEEAAVKELQENTRNDGYELMANGELSIEWVKAHREELDDQYREFLDAAVNGGTFKKADAANADPGAYVDLINRASSGEDIRLDAESALRGGRIKKAWYDQIVKQATDHRFGDADSYITTALKTEGEFNPAAQKMQANAQEQWQQWKIDHPDASRRDAMEEAKAIVEDASIVRGNFLKISTVRPRHAVMAGKEIDINATRAATMQEFMTRLQIPDGAPPERMRELLEADPAFRQQAKIIAEWEAIQEASK